MLHNGESEKWNNEGTVRFNVDTILLDTDNGGTELMELPRDPKTTVPDEEVAH